MSDLLTKEEIVTQLNLCTPEDTVPLCDLSNAYSIILTTGNGTTVLVSTVIDSMNALSDEDYNYVEANSINKLSVQRTGNKIGNRPLQKS
ncbi:MAG: hypothetical protein JKY48_18840 [Flavobacteriales bacterium]|nr:hypothetical protein [Flavobacteriales bacterium]